VTTSIRKVAVIGAGQAGRRFALRCAQSGFDVIVEDVMPANLRRAEAEFSDLSGQMATGSMTFALTVEDAVRDADIAIDFVPDELESKLEIFCLIDRMAPPKTILCTPSEALSITDLASCTYRPDRCLALRGDLISGGHLDLLHPPQISPEALTATNHFFTTLDLTISTRLDPDAPMLMKNIQPSSRQ
jgi:3-hydroxybutyryl-CoA dehydrogenase